LILRMVSKRRQASVGSISDIVSLVGADRRAIFT
jgi:hypothetical protein